MTRPGPAAEPLLTLDGLALAGRGGPVFAPVSTELAAGVLGAVVGRSGTGRSSLLLACAGRMRGLTGSGRLAGLDLIRQSAQVRRRTAVARVADLVDLEPQLTVEESVVERSLTEGVAADLADARVTGLEELLGCTFPRATLVEDLPRLDRARLTLVLAAVRPSSLIVFDDAERGLDAAQQADLYAAMTAVAGTGPTVLASTLDAGTLPSAATVIALPR